MNLKMLIIEDQELMIDGYIAAFGTTKIHDISFTKALDCETAYDIITNTTKLNYFDIAVLDYSLPAYHEKDIFTGVDLGLLIRELMPNTKIMMLTTYADAIKLRDVVDKIAPNALFNKTDAKVQHLIEGLESVLHGKLYYSPTVQLRVKESLFSKGLLDSKDRTIIECLALGKQTRSIAAHMSMSEEGIKKRKNKIRVVLDIEKGNDEEILAVCRKLGLI